MSTHRIAFPIMGTVATVVIAAHLPEREARVAAATAQESLAATEARFSHFRADSEIERWLAGGRAGVSAVAEIRHVLDRCAQLAAHSAGAFRINKPSGRLDTAGYVKGYAIGKAVTAVRELGINDFTLNVGGDSFSSGRAGIARPWRVAVSDPRGPGILAVLDATDLGVATSGTAERGSHIWDAQGAPVGPGLLSLTVTGPDIALADAYATAAFAMGIPGVAWVGEHPGYQAMALTAGGQLRGGLDVAVPAHAA